MKISHQPPSNKAIEILKALQTAVNEALEKKRRLGHYAVFWSKSEDRPLCIGDDAPEISQAHETKEI